MSDLTLVKSEMFGSVQCDFYQDKEKQILLTRKQIGEALEYSNPNDAVKDIHKRHKDRLDAFSRVAQIALPSGGAQPTTVYSTKGVYEVCRWSQQSKANEFYDWVYEMLEALRTGEVKVISKTDGRIIELKMQELEIKAKNAEARLKNAQVRQSRFILEEADKRKTNLSPESYELLQINGFEAVVGKNVLPRPKLATELYDLTAIAEKFGILSSSKNPHAQAVGAIVSKLTINESERMITAFDRYGHQGSGYQYTPSVLDKVKEWLVTNGHPTEIPYVDSKGGAKTYKVTYRES